MNITFKKIILLVVIVICILGCIYLAMFLDTNQVVRKLERHIKGEIPLTEEVKDTLNDEFFSMLDVSPKSFYSKPDGMLYLYNFNYDNYNIRGYHSKAIKENTKYKIKRKFVWHNFKDGFIDVYLSVGYYDKNGMVSLEFEPMDIKLKIHKENGEWYVMEIT